MAGAFLDTTKTTRINKENFALNDRLYDPAATNLLTNSLVYAEETRVQARPLYAIRLDNNPFETNVISGLNTKARSPIELVIKIDSGNVSRSDVTMYTCYWHDYIVNYKWGNTETYGQH